MSITAAVIAAARDLRSESGENPEYDRALVELSANLLGIDPDNRNDIANEILGGRR